MALVVVLLEVLEVVEVAAQVMAVNMVGRMESLGMEVVVVEDKVRELDKVVVMMVWLMMVGESIW